jgi:CBS domain-containing protein
MVGAPYPITLEEDAVMIERKTIKDAIKRKFPVIDIEDSLHTAINKMAKHNVSVLAVKIKEELIGIVTISDVIHSLANDADLEETTISSFMTKCEFDTRKATRNPCIQLDENEEALAAIKVMYEAGVNHLLVSGDKGEPIGIVSSLEIVKVFASQPEVV